MKKKFILSLLLLVAFLVLLFNLDFLVLESMIFPKNSIIYFENIINTFIWLTIGYMINLFINNVIWQKLAVSDVTKSPPRLLVQLSSFFLFLIIISVIFHNVFNYSVTTIWAASGALGLVIGFALKNLILDTFSGLAINLEKPFKVGDWINCHTKMGSHSGQVIETNWRATRLKNSANNIISIPNSFLTNTLITNYSMTNKESRFEELIVLDFSVDVNRAIKIIETALSEAVINGALLNNPKKPKVKVDKIVELGIQYKIKYFIDPLKTSPSAASSLCLQYLINHLSHAGISPLFSKDDLLNDENSMEDKQNIILHLKRLSLFKILNKNDLEILASDIKIKTISVGESIVKEGEEGDSMFIIIEGLLEVYILNNKKQLKVANLSPGSFFGEKSLLTGEFRSATIKAVYPSVVGEIPKIAMKKLMDSNQNVVDVLSNELASRELNNQNVLSDSASKVIDKKGLELKTNMFMKKIKAFFS